MQLSHMIKSLIITLPFLVFTVNATESKNYFPKESNNKLDQNDVRHLVKMNPTNYITENGSYKNIQEDLNKVYFDFDKSTIKRDYAKVLDEHAKFLLSHPSYNVMIEGHADERGTFIYNFALGERRALAVKDYLLSRGVSSRQLYTVSYGKEKPAVFGHDAKTYAQNRRTVIVY